MRFAPNERASTTLALIAEILAAAGGVPARVLADRMACLKGGVVEQVARARQFRTDANHLRGLHQGRRNGSAELQAARCRRIATCFASATAA